MKEHRLETFVTFTDLTDWLNEHQEWSLVAVGSRPLDRVLYVIVAREVS